MSFEPVDTNFTVQKVLLLGGNDWLHSCSLKRIKFRVSLQILANGAVAIAIAEYISAIETIKWKLQAHSRLVFNCTVPLCVVQVCSKHHVAHCLLRYISFACFSTVVIVEDHSQRIANFGLYRELFLSPFFFLSRRNWVFFYWIFRRSFFEFLPHQIFAQRIFFISLLPKFWWSRSSHYQKLCSGNFSKLSYVSFSIFIRISHRELRSSCSSFFQASSHILPIFLCLSFSYFVDLQISVCYKNIPLSFSCWVL